MRLSIVIVNWNTTDLLKVLLKSVDTHAPAFDYEVIVVDNASDDFDEQSFRAEFPSIKLIVNRDNAGYARANNQAIEVASGDYILLLNPDTEVTEGAVEALVGFMDDHPDAAAAGAKLVRPDGTIDHSVRGFPYPGPIAWEITGLSRLYPKSNALGAYRMTYFNYEQAARVDQPMGSCLILSRRAVEDVGSFDEQFPIFFNEVDWLFRAKAKGYKVYYTPSATVIHHGGAGTKQADRSRMVRESHESLIRFYRKHFKGKITAPVYCFAIICIHIGKFVRARA